MGNFVHNNTRLIGAQLDSTSNTTIYTAAGYAHAIGVRVANVTSGEVAATVNFYSTTDNTQYRLLFQHPVAGNTAIWLPLDGFGLNEGDQIRVQAGSSNALHVVLSIAEVPGRSG